MVLVQTVVLQPINPAAHLAANQQPKAQAKQVEKRSITDDETFNLFSIQAVNANEEAEDLEVAETHVFRYLL
jgi:hypothetical protein